MELPKVDFINLSGGLKAVDDYNLKNFHVIRIQSTWCEQKRWEDILISLSDDFLFNAALGNTCVIYDYGARKPIPRAVWHGVQWIIFTLNKRWHSVVYHPVGRCSSSLNYFEGIYLTLSKRTKARLDYFGKFVSGPLDIQWKVGSMHEDTEKIIKEFVA